MQQQSTELLWDNLNQSLKGFIYKRVKDRETTDDILQEVFLKIQLHLNQLKESEKLEQWVFQIARNAIHDHFRNQQKIVEQQLKAIQEEKSTGTSPLNEEVASWLPNAIDLLPHKYREALTLTEIEGLSQKELAERLGISYSGAKSRVQRGKAKLKEVILQCCEVKTDNYGNVLDYYPQPPK